MKALDPISFPLWGSRLIEASAGTGKTWTIAALYLRLILGHRPTDADEAAGPGACMPSEILVMTFTRAATQELSDRIRQRLMEAARCFRNEQPPAETDAFMQQLLQAYPEGEARLHAAWRLSSAAEAMDEAAIHTLDAWCQRMLREHAFDSGSLFDEELVADEQALLEQAVQDYWRQQVYPLHDEELEQVLATWSGVQDLAVDVASLMPVLPSVPVAAPISSSLQACIQQAQADLVQAVQSLAQGWEARAQKMMDWLDGQLANEKAQWNGRKLQARYYQPWLNRVMQWAQNPQANTLDLEALETARFRLSPEGLSDARKVPGESFELPPHFGQFAELLDAYAQLKPVSQALRWHALGAIAKRVSHLKQQGGTFGFSDLLQRMNQALAGPQGHALRLRILAQFPVALVDEFQDTSPVQYQMLDQLYRVQDNDPATALLLIGDPKQSIYGFRGADIASYLAARQATEGRHFVLGTNHRSSQGLVKAVNDWFGHAEQAYPLQAFRYVTWESGRVHNPLPFHAVQAKGRDEVFQTSDGPLRAMQLQFDSELRNRADSRQHFAARCAEQVVQWLNDPNAGFVNIHTQAFQVLKPADIALLVRTGSEAQALRHQLHLRGVASVYLSDKDSVFSSQEAMDLWHWLLAVANPSDSRLLRAAWATRMINLSVGQLQTLANDDERFDTLAQIMRDLHQVWMNQGVLAMLRQSLHRFELPAQWLEQPDGERRLTNYLHLAELLQNASATLEGEQALLVWLGEHLQGQGRHSDEQVLRLESDADLVKVITIHKSKGLEFPIVCVPFACSYRKQERRSTRFVKKEGPPGEPAAVLLHYTDEDLALADEQRLREELRLLYVAMTRPRYLLWMGFAMLTQGRSKDCKTHESAAGYLVVGPDAQAPSGYAMALKELAAKGDVMEIVDASVPVPCSAWLDRSALPLLAEPLVLKARFDKRWAIGSFSGLVKAMDPLANPLDRASAPGLPLLQTLRPADDENLAEEIGAQFEPTQIQVPQAVPEPFPVWHRLSRGALMGNFLHEQLEWLAGEGYGLPNPASAIGSPIATHPVAERLLRRCERAGYEAIGPQLVQWLSAVVHAPIAALGESLFGLTETLPEMEFWLPVAALKTKTLDALCQAHIWPDQPRPDLPDTRLHGFLMGFADLVFEHQGRYWVLDYKSNALGEGPEAYGPAALQQAVVQHRYEVQASLYLLALHRLLKCRLGNVYQPEQHLGGALVFFIRGIDGPVQGVVHLPPSLPVLDGLQAMLDEEALPC